MLSLINLSLNDRAKTVISNLHADFAHGCIHGFFAADAGQLKPLFDAISGQYTGYAGSILYNGHPLAGKEVSYTDCRCLAVNCETPGTPSRIILQQTTRKARESRPLLPRIRLKSTGNAESAPGCNIDYSKKVVLLHQLQSNLPGEAYPMLPGQLRQFTAQGNTVLISSEDYSALRNTCDYIYLYDKKRFPIVVEKADFAQFDGYFENVFGPVNFK